MTVSLLWVGLLVFGVGVAIRFLGGEGLEMVALVIQLVGAALLFANAGRSRRRALQRDDDELEG